MRVAALPVDRLEVSLEDWAAGQIRAAGGRAYKIQFRGRRGAPDNLVVWPAGVKDLVEYKRKKDGRTSKGQSAVHKELAGFGCKVLLINSRDLVTEYVQLRQCARPTDRQAGAGRNRPSPLPKVRSQSKSKVSPQDEIKAIIAVSDDCAT